MLKGFLKKLVLVIITIVLAFQGLPASAISNAQRQMFSANNILFYDPDGSSGNRHGSSCALSTLEGGTLQEKIWNWFVNAGISGVSDNPSVIAGIMGNLQQESGLNPFAESSSGNGYYGIFQDSKKYDSGFITIVENAVGDHWGQSTDSVSEDILNQALDVELSYLMGVGDYSGSGFSRTSMFYDNLGVINNNSDKAGARSYADLFLVAVEGAITSNATSGNTLEDSGVQTWADSTFSSSKTNGKTYWQEASKRRGYAEDIYANISGSSAIASCGDLNTFEEYVTAYAWPEYHSAVYLDRMPAYAEAVAERASSGKYIGGTVGGVAGIDCGGFVTTLMQESGWDPGYNPGSGNTYSQEDYVSANWERLNPNGVVDTSILQPGDVAFTDGHTFVYVGNISGFGSNIASASYGNEYQSSRAPMAGKEGLEKNSKGEIVRWYRKV